MTLQAIALARDIGTTYLDVKISDKLVRPQQISHPDARYLRLKVVRNRTMIDLREKVVVIAGANGGIGSHVAEVLVECGATTALGFHNSSVRVEEVRVKAA